MQPPDPWARPPRPQDKKRRWPLIAGVGVAGVLGLGVLGSIAEEKPSSVATTTSTTRPAETSTPTRTPATTSATSIVTPVSSTVAAVTTPTTTADVPVVPVGPTTTTQAPPPPPPVVITTTTAPAPAPFVAPAPAPSAPNVYYDNCKEARAAGAAPIMRGEPGYRAGLDRNNDGVACE